MPLPPDVETRLREALIAGGVEVGGRTQKGQGEAREPLPAVIGPGGRDDAGNAEGGECARRVTSGELNVWQGMTEIETWCRAAFIGPDAPDPMKFVDRFMEFLLRDAVVHDGKSKVVMELVPGLVDADGEPMLQEVRMLPLGWDQGLTDAEKSRWGFGVCGLATARSMWPGICACYAHRRVCGEGNRGSDYGSDFTNRLGCYVKVILRSGGALIPSRGSGTFHGWNT